MARKKTPVTVRVNRRSSDVPIELLRNVNRSAAKPRPRFNYVPSDVISFDSMVPGESVFLPGFTTNAADRDPAVRRMSMSSYTKNNTRVWTVRSTVEKGVKGVRVYRNV